MALQSSFISVIAFIRSLRCSPITLPLLLLQYNSQAEASLNQIFVKKDEDMGRASCNFWVFYHRCWFMQPTA